MRNLTTTLLLVLATVFAPVSADAQTTHPGGLDPSFGHGGLVQQGFGLEPTRGGAIQVVAESDGKALVLHRALHGFSLTQVFADGSFDPSFGDGGFVAGDFNAPLQAQVNGMALQADGSILVIGSSGSEPFTSEFALSRFLPDGSLDRSFGEGGSISFAGQPKVFAGAEQVALQPDGRILLLGRATEVLNGLEIVRLSASGSLDRSFGEDGFSLTPTPQKFISGAPLAQVMQGGELTVVLGSTKILRYQADGRLDPSFGGDGMIDSNLISEVSGLAIDDSGRILLAGSYGKVARFLPDGSPDASFGVGGLATQPALEASPGPSNASPDQIALAADGHILLAGQLEDRAGPIQPSDLLLARLTTDGKLDPSFAEGRGFQVTDIGGNLDVAASLALLPDGRAIVGGTTGASGSELSQIVLARYTTEGVLDPSFGVGGTAVIRPQSASKDFISALIVDPLGRTVATGRAGGEITVVRYLKGGKPDPGFGVDGVVRSRATAAPLGDKAESLARLEDGRLLVGSGSPEGGAVLAYQPDGEPDRTFGTEGIIRTSLDHVLDLEALKGGGFLAAGLVRSPCEDVLARFTSTGQPDLRFGGGDGQVRLFTEAGPCGVKPLEVARQPDGRIMVAGEREFLAQYTPQGNRVKSFGRVGGRSTFFRHLPDQIRALAVDRRGRILLGGSSKQGRGHTFALTELTVAGKADTAFGEDGTVALKLGTRTSVNAISVEASGRILAAGSAQHCEAHTECSPSRAVAVRLMANGSLDRSFARGGIWSEDLGFGAAANATALGRNTLMLGGWSIRSGQNQQFLLAHLRR
jgi:uncharacterized delta-60 repeat protein